MYYALNAAGKSAISNFLREHGRADADVECYYTEAEHEANGESGNGFDDDFAPDLTLAAGDSITGEPATLTLRSEWFDAAPVAPVW